MNYIDTIEIKNFKSIRHQKIEGCKRVNVFIGYPNVGKSNILEAIGLFGMNQEGEFDKTKNPSSPNKLVFNQICRIDEPIDLFFDKNYSEQLSVALNDKYRIQLNGSNDFSKLYFNLVMNDMSVSRYNDLTVLASMNVDTHDFWIRWHPTQGFYKNDEIYNRIKLYSFGNNPQIVSNDFFSLNSNGNNLAQIISTNEQVRSLFINLLKESNLKPHAVTGKYGIAKELSNGLVITFDSSLIADTLKRLLFHVAAINTNKNTVLIFEEPEAHMFPPYISKFTGEVMYDENNNQFFIATHSPFVINDFMENLKKDDYSIYTVGYDNETGETLVRRMTDEELHEIYQYGVDLFLNLEIIYLMHNSNKCIIPECYIDSCLIEVLLIADKDHVNHHKGNGKVANEMKSNFKDDFCLGIIDEDKEQLDYLKEFETKKITSYLKLWKHKGRHHYIIQIRPVVEKWFIRICQENEINLTDFRLPTDLKVLLKITKTISSKKDERFIKLFKQMKIKNCQPVLELRIGLSF